MFGAVVDGVDADPVSVDVEVVARGKFADSDRGRAGVVRCLGDESSRLLVCGVVSRVRSPEADFECDGVVEKRVVREEAEGFKGAERVLIPCSGDPAGDVTQLGDDATERLGVLIGWALQGSERLLAFPETVTLVHEVAQMRLPALQHSLGLRTHVGRCPRSEPGCDGGSEVAAEEADESSENLWVPSGIEDLGQPAASLHSSGCDLPDGARHLAGPWDASVVASRCLVDEERCVLAAENLDCVEVAARSDDVPGDHELGVVEEVEASRVALGESRHECIAGHASGTADPLDVVRLGWGALL